MRRIIPFIAAIVALAGITFANQGSWPVPGPSATVYSSGTPTPTPTPTPPSGGTLLAGDDTTRAISTSYLLSDQYAIHYRWQAVASGSLVKGYARIQHYSGSTGVKMVVWNGTTGEIIAVSAAAVSPATAALVEFTFSTGATTSGHYYNIGIIAEGYIYIAPDPGTSWQLGYASNSYTTPTNLTTVDPGDHMSGVPEMYITN